MFCFVCWFYIEYLLMLLWINFEHLKLTYRTHNHFKGLFTVDVKVPVRITHTHADGENVSRTHCSILDLFSLPMSSSPCLLGPRPRLIPILMKFGLMIMFGSGYRGPRLKLRLKPRPRQMTIVANISTKKDGINPLSLWLCDSVLVLCNFPTYYRNQYRNHVSESVSANVNTHH